MVFASWEKDAWLPPPLETPAAWAERVIVLPRGVSAIAGPLSLEHTPFAVEWLNAIAETSVRKVVLCTSAQVAKTTTLLIALLRYVDCDPWNMMMIMPNKDEALELKNERFIPIIKESPVLSKYIDPAGRGQFSGDTIYINGCSITFRGSHSDSGLSSKPVRVVATDEVNKYDRWTGDEADPIDLVSERMKTFHDSKLLMSSTPTTADGRIDRELAKSTNERCFLPCPFCGEYQILIFGDGSRDSAGIRWPEGLRDPDRIEHESLAWYECGKCHERIDERWKRQMVSRYVWAPHEAHVAKDRTVSAPIRNPVVRGFKIWAAYSLWPGASWSKCAGAFLRSKGSSEKLMNFRNSWQAEPWQVTVHELKQEHLRDRRGSADEKGYMAGTPPKGARVLTVGVDVQERAGNVYQYYVIRAWGLRGETWLLSAGISQNWETLFDVIFNSQYFNEAEEPLPIECVFVDSGYKTDEVYQFCELYGAWAAKGHVRQQRPYTPTTTETVKGSGRYLRRVNVNSDFYKGHIHGLVKGPKWHLPEDISDEYLAHLTAEQLVNEVDRKSGKVRYRWKVVTPGRPNHFLDCEVLAHCAGQMLELGHRREIVNRPTGPVSRPAQGQHVQQTKSRLFTR